MSKDTKKGVQVTLDKDLAERLALLRKFKHRLPHLNEEISRSIEGVVSMTENRLRLTQDTWKTTAPCPSCEHGVLLEKRPKDKKKPPFIGCNRFPECRYSKPIQNQSN